MKTLNIEIPEGHEIDLKKSNLSEGVVAFKKIKKTLPKTWEELKSLGGYYVTAFSSIEVLGESITNFNKTELNTFRTIDQAEASIALAQLSQLREVYRNGWVPDWTNDCQNKCVISFTNNKLRVGDRTCYSYFLSFQERSIAEEFLENFRDLIEQAKPLMS